MFQDKVSHAKLKKDEAVVNMVLVVEIKSQNLILMLQQRKEPQKTKTANDWEKEEKLQRLLDQKSNKCKH
jgi:translation initiation factor 2 alpha subunit (eIF-2alpha)